MPRERDVEGGAGRPAIRSFRDVDWEDFVAAVRYLPTAARTHGVEWAIAEGRTELRSLLYTLGIGDVESQEGASAKAAVVVFLGGGSLRLMCDDDAAGFNQATDFITVVAHECFGPSVRSVFRRSAPTEERAYQPSIPSGRA